MWMATTLMFSHRGATAITAIFTMAVIPLIQDGALEWASDGIMDGHTTDGTHITATDGQAMDTHITAHPTTDGEVITDGTTTMDITIMAGAGTTTGDTNPVVRVALLTANPLALQNTTVHAVAMAAMR